MAYYNNEVVIYPDELSIFQRDLGIANKNTRKHKPLNWYYKVKVDGLPRPKQGSTKTADQSKAIEIAKKKHVEINSKLQRGESLDAFTFKQAWDDYVGSRAFKPDRHRQLTSFYNAHFEHYFRDEKGNSKQLGDIDIAFVRGYWPWRINKHLTPEGQRTAKYNRRRKGMKSTSSKASAKPPSRKTLTMEQGVLNSVFNNAYQSNRIGTLFRFEAPVANQVGVSRRPDFEHPTEYDLLLKGLAFYSNSMYWFETKRSNEWHKLRRRMYGCLWLVMLYSGIRPNEARQLRWRDVKLDVPLKGSDKRAAELDIPNETKTGRRTAQVMPAGNGALKAWLKVSEFTSPNDPVWYGQVKGDAEQAPQFDDLSKSFTSFLERIPVHGATNGLLYNANGEKRTVYSLRHTYATYALKERELNMEDLALNMGTSVAMIEQHYRHLLSSQIRERLVGEPNAPDPDHWDPADDPENA